MTRVRRRSRLLSWYLTVPLSIAVLVACGVMWFELDEDRKDNLLQWKFFPASEEEEDGVEFDTDEKSAEVALANLQAKYAAVPDFFHLGATADGDEGPGSSSLTPNQFLHLHHMKTGGTSMDALLRCAMDRMKRDGNYQVPYFNIHECSEQHYASCVEGHDARCLQQAQDASIMSYCAPLKDLPVFGWGNHTPAVGSITVLRHPVERVWSMYRFQTKACYKCRSLLDVYEDIDNGIMDNLKGDMCAKQLLNHETSNLLSTHESENNSDEERVQEAVANLDFFTVVGLTEELPATAQMAGQLFPWMAATVDWSAKECALTHANASPQNNRCGEGGTHMDLPPHPDEETRRVIEAHNQMDLKLYKAAVQRFKLQKLALGMED